VSRVLESCPQPGFRSEGLAARLRTHPWVQDARIFLSGMEGGVPVRSGPLEVLAIPSAPGVAVLRRHGKNHIVTEWVRYLGGCDTAGETLISWLLTESMPLPGHEDSHVGSLRSGLPIVSDVMVDHGARALACRLRVPYELPIFHGHFSDMPIVPGVTQVGWAVELARVHGIVSSHLVGINTAKFCRLVQPGMCFDVRLAPGAQAGQLQFTYLKGRRVVSTGRLQFEGGHV